MIRKSTYFLFITLFIILFGCSDNGNLTKIGSPISNRETISVDTLFEDTAAYDGRAVTIQGVIDEQDLNGYWFYLQDGDTRIYVEINNADFSIPDLVNKRILVAGVLEVQFNIPSLFATGLEYQK